MIDSVFEPFLNKQVIVETGSLQVKGKLVYYKSSENQGHIPFILVLEMQDRTIVLRDTANLFVMGAT
jgi:hypothetical protein